jgi:adenylate cyclase
MGRLRRGLALGAVIAVAGAFLSLAPPVLGLEAAVGLRALFGLRGALPAPDAVAVVGISAESAAAVGQPAELDEWSRSVHAELIERLAELGAAAIVFDMSFEQQRDAEDDRRLAAAIAAAGNVILFERVMNERIDVPGRAPPASAEIETRVSPLPALEAAAWGTGPFVLPRVPIRVDQFWVFGRSVGGAPTLPALALQAFFAADYPALAAAATALEPKLAGSLPATEAELRAADLEAVVQTLRDAFRAQPALAAGALRWLTSERGAAASERLAPLVGMYGGPDSRYLNFYGPARTVTTIPYDEVWSRAAQREADIRGRVVFVGYAERRQPEQQDEFYSVYSERSGQSLSGVEIAATAFANLLEMSSLAALSMPLHVGVVLAWGLMAGVLMCVLRPTAALAAAAVAGGGYLGGSYAAAHAAGVFVPLVIPVLVQLPLALLAGAVWSYRVLRARSERIRAALGHYVPAHVADRLAHETLAAGAGGALLHGTCLFTDAEQYTAVAESMDPRSLGAFMNDYYEAMFRAVQRNAGEIADFAGDSMVALWAAAQPDPEALARACRAALDVAAAVDEFNAARGRHGLHTRIGLDSGPVFVGHIGAQRRYEYRAVGDIVSTASRIQSLNRVLRTKILLSDAALPPPGGFVTREIGRFRLRGKSQPLRIHELVGARDAVGDGQDLVARFGEALAALRDGQWAQAEAVFRALLEQRPADGPARYYCGLAAQYQLEPPREWDGVITVTAK